MYGEYVSTATGRVTDPTGRTYDLAVVGNTPDAHRTYQGMLVTATYRTSVIQAAGNYTLSWSRGNVAGEGSGGPNPANVNDYMEYKQPAWNSPVGYNNTDQRHKVRAWLTYFIPVPARVGTLSVSAMQRLDSALPYDASGVIDSRPYVQNPGYLTPPSTVTYYFSARNALRFDPSWSTDVSIEWTKKIGPSRAAVFFRAVTTNLFNNAAVVSGDSTILTAASPGAAKGLQRFDPFTTRPVQGVNWAYGPDFGQPTSPDGY